jgi:uncharacterized membrane protein/photosystem II stability/assembly factor-like uncharacterized protein
MPTHSARKVHRSGSELISRLNPRFSLAIPPIQSPLKRLLASFLAGLLLFLWLSIPFPALGHRPHDVVTEVELSPTYSQDQTLFILVRGNLFKSEDGGLAWQRLVNGLDNRHPLTRLSISQQNPSVLFLSSLGDGIYQSKDGGLSWQKVNQGLGSLEIDLVATVPKVANLAFATAHTGEIYKTVDNGVNWTQVSMLSQPVTALEFVGGEAEQLVLGDVEGNLFTSEDGGVSWVAKIGVDSGFAIESPISAIALLPNPGRDPTIPTILVGTSTAGVFKSVDGGGTWVAFSEGLPPEEILDVEASIDDQGDLSGLASTWKSGVFKLAGETWQPQTTGLKKDSQAKQLKQPNFSDLEIADDGTTFLAGFDGLFKSSDRGQTWSSLETLARETIVALAISPNYGDDGTLAVVNYVGHGYLSEDQGDNWRPINNGLEVPRFSGSFRKVALNQDPRRFFDVAFSPNYGSNPDNDQTIFAALLWTKFLRTDNKGANWQIIPMAQEVRGLTIAVSPNFAADQTVFLSNQPGEVYRSTNGGKTFKTVGKIPKLVGNYGSALVISPNFAVDRTLYSSGKAGIYRSTDGGQGWDALTRNSPLAEAGKIQLAISPDYGNDRTLLVSTTIGVFKTTDAGETWQQLETLDKTLKAMLPGVTDPYFEGVAISPNYQNDQTFVVSVRGQGLFKTTDGGQRFASIGDAALPLTRMANVPSSGLPIQFSPNYALDQTLFGFGDAGSAIYRSTDGGNQWETLPIPVYQDPSSYNLTTRASLWFYIYQGRLVKLVVILAFILVSYAILTYLAQAQKPLVLRVWRCFIVTVLALGLFFRFAHLDQKVYSADEVRSILRLSGYTSQQFQDQVFTGEIVTRQDIKAYQSLQPQRHLGNTLTALSGNPEHPPLYPLLTRFWMQLFNDPLGARLIAIGFSLLALPCLYWLCLELFNSPLVGWITLLLVSASPFHIMAAQNTTQYSLWTLLIALSSTLLLRALRRGTTQAWSFYAISLAAAFYTHLFSAIVAVGHGIYVLIITFSQRSSNPTDPNPTDPKPTDQSPESQTPSAGPWYAPLLKFSLAGTGALVLFSPWLWIILTGLDKVEKNTRFYRGFDNDLETIIRRFISNLGNVFLDFHGQMGAERYFDYLLLGLVLFSLYFLWRHGKNDSRIFILILIVLTPIAHIVPDLISPSARSLQTRYYLPCFLGIDLALAFMIAGYMQSARARVWQQRLGQIILVVLISSGIMSGVFVTQIYDWGLDDQKGTASGWNLQIAPLINQADRPLVLSNATHSFVLALSHLVKDEVQFQLYQPDNPEEWQAVLDLAAANQNFSDIFVYWPDRELLEQIERVPGFTTENALERGGRMLLYRVVGGEDE